MSTGRATGQRYLLDRPFLLSASPISQMGKPRHTRGTHLGALGAQACTALPSPTW